MSPVSGVSGVSGVGGFAATSGVSAAARAMGATSTGASEGATQAGSFASTLTRQLENVQQLQGDADSMAVQAATGDLTDVHDYLIAATQAKVATELTVAVRNKAVDAFNEIMRMQA